LGHHFCKNLLTRGCASRSKVQASAKQMQRRKLEAFVSIVGMTKSRFVDDIGTASYQQVCTLLREA
jgi:hypothetical protein